MLSLLEVLVEIGRVPSVYNMGNATLVVANVLTCNKHSQYIWRQCGTKRYHMQ
jgi:hypothetical protein